MIDLHPTLARRLPSSFLEIMAGKAGKVLTYSIAIVRPILVLAENITQGIEVVIERFKFQLMLF